MASSARRPQVPPATAALGLWNGHVELGISHIPCPTVFPNPGPGPSGPASCSGPGQKELDLLGKQVVSGGKSVGSRILGCATCWRAWGQNPLRLNIRVSPAPCKVPRTGVYQGPSLSLHVSKQSSLIGTVTHTKD